MAISPARRGISLILPRVKHGAGLLQRTGKYASLLRILGALHLALFEQPGKDDFFMLTVRFSQFKSESFLVGFLPPPPPSLPARSRFREGRAETF
jgi:hypothetical protein